MTSWLVIFRAFYFFFRPSDPKSEKKSCKSANEKILASPFFCQTVHKTVTLWNGNKLVNNLALGLFIVYWK